MGAKLRCTQSLLNGFKSNNNSVSGWTLGGVVLEHILHELGHEIELVDYLKAQVEPEHFEKQDAPRYIFIKSGLHGLAPLRL